MLQFGANLRKRARELHISNAEAARRCGLGERRYHGYVAGEREPDLTTLVRIAAALMTTPNALLGIGVGHAGGRRQVLRDRLCGVAEHLADDLVELAIVQFEAWVRHGTGAGAVDGRAEG